jgi:major type 1 subunit fimbrin (pilin)
MLSATQARLKTISQLYFYIQETNMKKTVIALSVVFAVMAAATSVQAASTGTITFNGKLTANTCDAVVDNQAASATVTLPDVGTNVLDVSGKTAGRTGFSIALSNCAGSLQTASAYFEAGSTVDLPSGHLKNTTGSATNVSLQLRDGSSSSQAVIKAGNSDQRAGTTYVDISSGTATMPYFVEYYADDATGAGTVVSSVVYSIQYM